MSQIEPSQQPIIWTIALAVGGLLAALGLLVQTPSSIGTAAIKEASGSSGEETEEEKRRSDGPLEILATHFPSAAGKPDALRTLICTVPNPDTPTQAMNLDEHLTAIHRAAQDDGYTFLGHYLPQWEKGAVAAGGEIAQRDRIGSLLFMKVNDAQQVERAPPCACVRGTPARTFLLVLLVAESPVRGISRQAFGEALSTLHEVTLRTHCRLKVHYCQPLRMVGPIYSGTFESLPATVGAPTIQRQLKPWQLIWKKNGSDGRYLKIVTGAATSFDKSCVENDIPQCEVLATVYPLTTVLDRVLVGRYLGLNDANLKPRVAILSESNTAFGASIGAAKSPQSSDGGKCNEQTPRQSLATDYHVLRYPQQIAALSAPFLADREARRSLFSLRRQRQVQPRFEGRGESSPDLPRMFAPGVTPAIDEMTLEGTFVELADAGTHFVGVIATDVRDAVFLGQKVRERLPDTKLMFVEPHLQLALPENAARLRGALVASSYPPGHAAELGAEPQHFQKLEFVSEAQQGVYNAVLAQLGSNKLRGYGDGCIECMRPKVWISMVGNHGLWPIQSYTVYPPDGQGAVMALGALNRRLAETACNKKWPGYSSSPPPERHNHAHLPVTFIYALSVWTVIALGSLILCFGDSSGARPLRLLATAPWRFPGDDERAWHRIAFHVAVCLVGAVLLVLLWNQSNAGFCEDKLGSIGRWALTLILLCCVASLVCAMCFHCHRTWGTPISEFVQNRRFLYVIAVCYVAAIVAVACFGWSTAQSEGATGVREVHLDSGVSLALPLVLSLTALALWSAFQYSQLSLDLIYQETTLENEGQEPYLKSLGDMQYRFNQLNKLDRGVWSSGVPWRYWATMLALLALSAWWFWAYLWTFPQVISCKCDLAVLIAVCSCLLLSALECMRVAYYWRLVSILLGRAWELPVGRAYEELSIVVGRRLGKYLDRADKGLKTWLDGVREAYWAEFQTAWARNAFPHSKRTNPPRMEDGLKPVIDELRGIWSNLPVKARYKNRGKAEDRDAFTCAADRVVAIECVAMLAHCGIRLRRRLVFSAAFLAGALFTVCTFPFPRQTELVLLLAVANVLWLLHILRITLICDRDEILSRINRSTPNQVNWDPSLASQLAGYLAPIVAALAAVFPRVWDSFVVLTSPVWTTVGF